MWRRVSLVLLLVAVAALAGGPVLAAAALAPQYTGSEPADGAELHEPPEEVKVSFSEPLDPSSTLEVKACGERVDDGEVTVTATEMTVGLEKTPLGHYRVRYTAVGLGGLTGQDSGEFGFHLVHGGTACDGSAGEHHGGGGHTGHDPKEKHDGHDRSGTDHGRHGAGANHGTDHTTGDHAAGGDHTEHMDDSANEHHEHAGGNANANTDPKVVRDRVRDIAAGQAPFPPLSPDSTAVLLALGLAGGFGVVGGWLLRVSG